METENDQQIEELGSRTRLYLATLSVNFLYVSAGSTQAWTSPTLPKLVNILTPDEASLVGSLYSFGAAFGPIIGALCLNSLGRKGTLYVLGGCFLISWIILAPTYNVYVLYVGRFIGGIGVGGTLSCAAMYLAEVADKKSRGPINSINHTSLALGCLIEYAVGPWTSYLTLILVSGLSAILFFITFFFIPESFYYLLIKERKQEAIESLRWFRGNISEISVQKELNEIQESIRIRQENKDGWKTMLQRGPLISLCICFYLLTIEQGSGNTAIVGFAQLIFEEAHVAVSGAMIPIIGSVAIFFAGLLSPFIVNRFSMKIAFIFSSFGVAFALGLMAIFFYLDSIGKAVPAVSFLPVLGFVLYKVFFCWEEKQRTNKFNQSYIASFRLFD
ncbi:hypothetical protein O3M35_012279 [Rhynocoris fuscipes]|uniref:Major facilitator superfamily (MFS) profile domain-containing protein n=1 Tax=Rhynocoris fuscipes TaxID=488301 RepID=A0AAW1CTG8_9HEMI